MKRLLSLSGPSAALLALVCLLRPATAQLASTNTPALPPGIGSFPDAAAFPGEGPTRGSYDWFRKLWIERRSDWWRQRSNDQGAVVFLGDSITQGWGSLAKDFPGVKVANRGISGDTTRGVRYRLKEDVLDLHPRAVVLLIGTNDLEEQAKPDLIAGNVAAILATCRKADAKLPLILCQVMPSSASKKRPVGQIQQINALLAGVAKDCPGCTLVDTWTPFANDAGDARPEQFPDLLHPNPAGYQVFADTLRPVLQKLGVLPPRAE